MTSAAPFAVVELYERLKARALAEHPDIDAETLADTVDGAMDISPEDLVVRWLMEEAELKADAAALKALIDKYRTRMERKLHTAEARRDMAHALMEACEIKSITRPEMSVSRGPGPQKVLAPDPGAVPDEYCNIARTVRLKDVYAAIKAGASVPGARLSNGGEIIRVKIA